MQLAELLGDPSLVMLQSPQPSNLQASGTRLKVLPGASLLPIRTRSVVTYHSVEILNNF